MRFGKEDERRYGIVEVRDDEFWNYTQTDIEKLKATSFDVNQLRGKIGTMKSKKTYERMCLLNENLLYSGTPVIPQLSLCQKYTDFDELFRVLTHKDTKTGFPGTEGLNAWWKTTSE